MSVEHTIATIGINLRVDTYDYYAVHHYGDHFQFHSHVADETRNSRSDSEPQYDVVPPRPILGTLKEHIKAIVLPDKPQFEEGYDHALAAKRMDIYREQLLTAETHIIKSVRLESMHGRVGIALDSSGLTPHPGVLTQLSVLEDSGITVTEENVLAYLMESLTYSLGQHIENMLEVIQVSASTKTELLSDLHAIFNIVHNLANYAESQLIHAAIQQRYSQEPEMIAFYIRDRKVLPIPEKTLFEGKAVQEIIGKLTRIGETLNPAIVNKLIQVLNYYLALHH